LARSESFSLRSRSALRCRTLGRSRPRLAGLVPLMVKASVSNIAVLLRLVFVPKALAMARSSVVASLVAILPSPTSRFCLLAPLLLQQLAPYCPLILPDRSSTPRLHPVVVFHYLLAWCPMRWIHVITGATVHLWLLCRPKSPVVFPRNGDNTSSPPGPIGPSRANPFFCFKGSLLKGLRLSPVRLYQLFPYVSGVLLS